MTLDDKLGKPNKDNYVLVKLKAKAQIIYYFGRIMTDIDDKHMKEEIVSNSLRHLKCQRKFDGLYWCRECFVFGGLFSLDNYKIDCWLNKKFKWIEKPLNVLLHLNRFWALSVFNTNSASLKKHHVTKKTQQIYNTTLKCKEITK